MTPAILHAYAITGDFDESVKYAITHYITRYGCFPAAAWLHPSRIPPDWPPSWPPVLADIHLNRNIIGLEPPASPRPLQPTLL